MGEKISTASDFNFTSKSLSQWVVEAAAATEQAAQTKVCGIGSFISRRNVQISIETQKIFIGFLNGLSCNIRY